MIWILLVVGIGFAAASMSVRRLIRWASQAPDLAWRPTGIRYTTGRNYLQAQGIANALEARKHTATGRRYRHHLEPATSAEAVAPGQRGPTEVVPFHRRQA